ncbi:light-harvesting protein [uncultured Roseobacter sp.]|uniref:light-harvesting protein n=1 Tax=uncultured Roseobacter sp. TaxID=114847 RepID=UPI0026192807|nr:light-harvesting protein [uncultured Roseobacter sp.]
MNNAKMWLVVKPTVGVPLFLSAVAIGSFAVHVAVLTNTSWVSDFLSGQELGSGDQTAAAAMLNETDTAKATYVVPSGEHAGEVTIILSDGTPVKAILQPPEVHATAGASGSHSVITQ